MPIFFDRARIECQHVEEFLDHQAEDPAATPVESVVQAMMLPQLSQASAEPLRNAARFWLVRQRKSC